MTLDLKCVPRVLGCCANPDQNLGVDDSSSVPSASSSRCQKYSAGTICCGFSFRAPRSYWPYLNTLMGTVSAGQMRPFTIPRVVLGNGKTPSQGLWAWRSHGGRYGV